MTARGRVAVLLGIGLLLSGCSSGSAAGGDAAGATTSAGVTNSAGITTTTDGALRGTLQVDAAASLKGVFDQLAAQFEQANPGVEVSLSYDGSSVLATQLIAGAPVDVFASADAVNMAKVTDAKLITERPVPFATNVLQLAVAPGNPKHLTGLRDLARADITVDLCAPAQPCGAAAGKVLAAAGVTVTPVSTEQNVTAVLTKVRSGDVDAGLVYRTDVRTAGATITGVDLPEAAAAVNVYPIAALAAAPNAAAAKAFIALVTGPAGRGALTGAGFGPP